MGVDRFSIRRTLYDLSMLLVYGLLKEPLVFLCVIRGEKQELRHVHEEAKPEQR